MNTNGSRTADVIALCDAGLDSLRVSLNSCQKDLYHRYYLPKGYSFTDVKQSILEAKKRGKFVALNYLTMPGFTDREDEFKSLVKFISSTKVDMIQWRNLNYDPLAFFRKMKPPSKAKILGINTVIQRLKNKFPKLCHGYFNIPL